MFSTSSPRIVAPLAQALTESNRAVALRSSDLPLAAACESYTNHAEANKVAYSHRLATVSQEDFIADNAVPTMTQEAGFERQVELMAAGLKGITYTARNVIIPAVDQLTEAYLNRQSVHQAPEIKLVVWKYAAVHNEPGLVNHIQTRYARVAVQREYKTFMLGQKSAEAIIEMAATNNPHLDQESVTQWLLGMGAERITAVWQALFNTMRVFSPNMLEFTQVHRLPQTSDELLLAYCLCGHLMENPVDDAGESAGIEEWTNALQVLHEYFGTLLLRAYERRVDDARRGILVYRNQAVEPIKTLTVRVEVNGDIYAGFAERGLTAEAILGAAVYESHMRSGEDLLQIKDTLTQRWNRLYPLMRQAAADRAQAQRRQDIVKTVRSEFGALPEQLTGEAAWEEEVLMAKLTDAVRSLNAEDLENPFALFAKVVCQLFYTNPIYHEFLLAFRTYSVKHPEASARELALYSLIEVSAIWLASQGQVIPFTPQVDPNAVLPETEVVVSAEEEAKAEGEVSTEDAEADPKQ